MKISFILLLSTILCGCYTSNEFQALQHRVSYLEGNNAINKAEIKNIHKTQEQLTSKVNILEQNNK